MVSRLLRTSALALLASLLATFSARAYSPETGVWWNPNEPGTGLILDLQDNFMVVSLFVGDSQGNPTWFTSTGFLDFEDVGLYEGTLDRFPGAQCIGCGFRPVTPQIGVGGPIRILFDLDDSAQATLTIGGRSTRIERFRFYYKRSEDEQLLPGVSSELTRLMGEWSATLDYGTSTLGPGSYLGEVVILDRLDNDQFGDFVDGCRPADTVERVCTGNDLDNRYTVGEYDSSTGEHVIVVENSPTTFASYFIDLGSEIFRGEVVVYDQGVDPFTLDPSNFFPVVGFRSASRTFAENDPDIIGPSHKSGSASDPGPGLPLTVAAANKSASKVRSTEEKSALNAVLQRLETQLIERRAARAAK